MTPKKLVTLIAVGMLTLSLIANVGYVLESGYANFSAQLLRFGLEGLLAYFLVKGATPARWVAIVLMGIGGIYSLPAWRSFESLSLHGLTMLAMGVVDLICAVGLLTPLAGKHFTIKAKLTSEG